MSKKNSKEGQITGSDEKTYFYYPDYSSTKKTKNKKVVVAGVISDGKLLLGEATCFMGKKNPNYKAQMELVLELSRDGFITNQMAKYLVVAKQPVKGDAFDKKKGRMIAIGRALTNPIHSITIDETAPGLGKIFVEEVEKFWPLSKGRAARKEKETTEVGEQVVAQ